ncbi:MAG: hypothetical protein RMM51_01745 [Verrucomicrobiae bacterium]|nr:hypothetical protein [Verrucomicrobiae bacterium]
MVGKLSKKRPAGVAGRIGLGCNLFRRRTNGRSFLSENRWLIGLDWRCYERTGTAVKPALGCLLTAGQADDSARAAVTGARHHG